jgi:hypothetical protein
MFEVIIKHDYFTSGFSTDFSFKPTKECRFALSRYGLIFKSAANGFAVFYEAKETGGIKLPVKPISNDERFSFVMTLNNRSFQNFTELPLDNVITQRYYFDNLDDNKNGSDLLLVNDPVKKFVDKDDVTDIEANILNYSESSVNQSALVKILDKFNNVMMSKAFSNIGGRINAQFDLSILDAGVYKIEVDGVIKKTFYKDNIILFDNVFGIIDIFKNSSVPSDYRFADTAGNVSFKQYIIQFHRRSTIWKYFVIKKYKTTAPNLTLQVGANPALSGSPHILPDGTSSTLFDLLSPSELKEEPVENIKLISNGTILIQNLPNPSVEIIKPDTIANKVYSEVYVYI